MARHTPVMSVMVAAARKAARGLQRDFGEVENLQVSVKGPANFVSAADKKAEKTLFEELNKARPGYGFLMEEGGVVEGADKSHRWIIDPLDGTTNFLHSIPQFAISIGLEREGQIVAGVIYNPITDELYTAEKGGGAYLNDRRIRVAARRELNQSIVACGVPDLGRPGHERFLGELSHVMKQVAGVRRMGAASLDLAYVAAGRFDAYWEANLAPWDMAAGIIMVREAGGYIADLKGGEDMLGTGGILAGNEILMKQLAATIKVSHTAA
ncbi:MAG: inositol monophosphatase [Rhizobiales bacterium]|nr:inositol monophosphatase [Hyphomicrobiales bacterium]